jgi:predicted nuclease of predicted toxin-antitoxin system
VTARLKVDEDLPPQVAEILTAYGHDARTVVAQGWRGFPDSAVWEGVQPEKRWLVTGDKGFADLRAYPPGTHIGVILLRPQEESRRAYVRLIEAAIAQLDLDTNAGATVVVTPHGVRIRRPNKL